MAESPQQWTPPHRLRNAAQIESQQGNSRSRGMLQKIVRSRITWVLGACALFVWKCGVPKIEKMSEDKRRNDAIAAEDERAREDIDKLRPRDKFTSNAELAIDPNTGFLIMRLLSDKGGYLEKFPIDECGEAHPFKIRQSTTKLSAGGLRKIDPWIYFDAHGSELVYTACEPTDKGCEGINVTNKELRDKKIIKIQTERVIYQ